MIREWQQADTITDYGFRWGQVEVARAFERDGYRVLTLTTPRRTLDIYITPTGLIRVGTERVEP